MQEDKDYRKKELFQYACIFIGLLGTYVSMFAISQPFQMVHKYALVGVSLKYAAGIILISFIMLRKAFRGSFYWKEVLGAWLKYGATGIILGSFGALFSFNMLGDASAPQLFVSRIVDKNMTPHSPRGGRKYLVRIEGWHNSHETIPLFIGAGEYEQARVGVDSIRIHTHPGRLGYEWIENYELVSK